MLKKLSSRKFWLAQQIILLSVAVPLLFRSVGVSEAVTLMSMGVISGAGTLYGIVSTVDKKINGGVGQ